MIDLDQVLIDPGCAMCISAEFAITHRVLPICEIDGDFMVAMADTRDVRTQAEIRRETGLPVVAHEAEPDKLDAMLRRIYGSISAAQIDATNDDAISTVDYLLRMAFLRHASDVHFDPDENGIRVRYRIDGELEDVMRVSVERSASVIARLKVLGDMKLDERREPQDGAFSWLIPDAFGADTSNLDIRMATLPGHYGEKVTLRLLETNSERFTVESLGMLPEDFQEFSQVMMVPHGMVLLTGPTGSGKTTTLYAAIQHLLSLRALNIVTVENPVEYEIPGIFQAEVDAVDKVNFSKALRSILRHDPDVIMIGEIRDRESLETAVNAALTGHLVLSTLHTNDSVGTVSRLVNMGLERHLISATLRLSIAQRLVRKLCPHCRQECIATENDALALGCDDIVGSRIYRRKGCLYCGGRGLRGRVALFEFFRPNAEIAAAIAEGANDYELRKLVKRHAFRSMLDDGVRKCQGGITMVSEVARAAYGS